MTNNTENYLGSQFSPQITALSGGDETIKGTAAADTITFTSLSTTVDAGEGANTITGTSGNNLIIAGSGADTITVTFGDNTIKAGDGANTITATYGDNTIITGSGADTITVTSGNNIIHAGDGANTITATSGVNAITTDSDNDIGTASPRGDGAFFDERHYNERNMADGQSMDDDVDDDWGDGNNNFNFDLFDRITIASDGNIITTGSGADTITMTSGNNTIDAGDGANTITATSGDNTITVGSGADTITVTSGANTIKAGDGANTITATSGVNTITTGSGADTITTGGLAGGGNTIDAGDGANTIATGAGNDIIYTGIGIDTIATGAGDDVINIKGGTDTIAAGAGNDTLIADLSAATSAVSINALAGTVAAGYAGNISGLGIATFAGVENFEITSGDSDDAITTGDGNDVVQAGAGSDTVNLAGGNDEAIYTMAANTGASDVYQGGAGVDTLTLEFTQTEWDENRAIQTDIANYQEHLASRSSDSFVFKAFGLDASEFENLSVRIGHGNAADMTTASLEGAISNLVNPVGVQDGLPTPDGGAATDTSMPATDAESPWTGLGEGEVYPYWAADEGEMRDAPTGNSDYNFYDNLDMDFSDPCPDASDFLMC